MIFLIALLVVGGFALYVMTPNERVRLLRRAVDVVQHRRRRQTGRRGAGLS